MKSKDNIVIIGNGISGITCARHIRKKNSSAVIQVISGESEHFFSRTALMYVYMGHMKYEHIKPYEDWFWEKNRIELIHDWVVDINFENKELKTASGTAIPYSKLVLATGSKSNTFGWSGQDLNGVQGLYSLQDLEIMEKNTNDIHHAVIVGGGLIGIELVEMLKSRGISVSFLVRESRFWEMVLPAEESKVVERHIREHDVDLRLDTELSEVLGDGKEKVTAVLTSQNESISCQFVGLGVGVSPNVEFLKNTSLKINRGILVDEYFATSVEDVYAIGDCAEFPASPGPDRKPIEQVWYTGRMHGETLAHSLTVKPVPYRPGVWFNSAKFFDIEYQVYGTVPSKETEGIHSFYWEHASGKACFRAVYELETGVFIGSNTLGMRVRHEFMDTAIKRKWSIDKVMDKLRKADFNSEFHEKYAKKIQAQYKG